MPLSRVRFYLRLLLGILLLGVGEVLVWTALTPGVRPVADVQLTADEDDAADLDDRDLPSLAEFTHLWSLWLRRPLTDAKAASQTEATTRAARAPLRVKLLGTMIESERASAIFSNHLGRQEIRGVGETVGRAPAGAKVLRISAKEVVLIYRGQEMTLKLVEPPPATKPSNAANNKNKRPL